MKKPSKRAAPSTKLWRIVVLWLLDGIELDGPVVVAEADPFDRRVGDVGAQPDPESAMPDGEIGEGGPGSLERKDGNVNIRIEPADVRPRLGRVADLDHHRRAAVDQRLLLDEGLERRHRVQEVLRIRIVVEPQDDVRVVEVDRLQVAELDRVGDAAEGWRRALALNGQVLGRDRHRLVVGGAIALAADADGIARGGGIDCLLDRVEAARHVGADTQDGPARLAAAAGQDQRRCRAQDRQIAHYRIPPPVDQSSTTVAATICRSRCL